MVFDNNASEVGFILEGTSIEDVIAQDAAELEQIGGSMDAISERMLYFQSKFYSKGSETSDRKGQEGFYREEIVAWKDHTKKDPILDSVYHEGVYTVQSMPSTDGVQDCPFSNCTHIGAHDVGIVNTRDKKRLIVNDVTIHLAKEHQLLEKSNQYGISAKDFYEYFMK